MRCHVLRSAAVLVASLGFAPAAVYADPLVLNLNCILSSSGCAPSATWGTITLTDNNGDVDLDVDLVDTPAGTTRQKMLGVWLNYNDSLFDASDDFETLSTDGVDENENKKKAGPYNAGKFDLVLPDSGNGGFEPFTVTMHLEGFNLDSAHFAFSDTSGLLWAAVHIGNCGSGAGPCLPGAPAGTNASSIWVGATGPTETTPEDDTALPEPASLFLLGTGFVALARRRQNR
jgi:hypothetical protein